MEIRLNRYRPHFDGSSLPFRTLILARPSEAVRKRQGPYQAKKVVGREFQALSVAEAVMPCGKQEIDLDLEPEQIRGMQRWLRGRQMRHEMPLLVLLNPAPNGTGKGRGKHFGKVGVIVRVTKIAKDPESEKHKLEYVGLDRCSWKFRRRSQLGIDTVLIGRSFEATQRWPTGDDTALLRTRGKITRLAKELADGDPELKAMARSLETAPEGQWPEFTRRLFWNTELLDAGLDEIQGLLSRTQVSGMLAEFLRLLEQRAKTTSTTTFAGMGERAVAQSLRQTGVPEAAREVLGWDIREMQGDSTSYRRVVMASRFPWGKTLPWKIDLVQARRQLDEEFIGLPEEKRWILAFLKHLQTAGRATKPSCLVGPAGVGKTSLIAFMAQHMGLPLAILPFGGVMTSEELCGTNATYTGAKPSVLLQELVRFGALNPIIVFEEIDKVNPGDRLNPYPALVHLLDPKRNHAFMDLYLGCYLDYSKVTFMATANDFEALPGPVKQRLREVRFAAYSQLMKFALAEQQLIPQLLADSGVEPGTVQIPRSVMRTILERRVHEGGVRNFSDALERLIWYALTRKPKAHPNDPVLVTFEDELRDLGEYTRKPIIRVADHRGKPLAIGVDDFEGRVDVLEVYISPKPAKFSEQWQVDTGLQGRDMREVNRTVRAAIAANLDRIGKALNGKLFTKKEREKLENILWNHSILIHMPPPGEETSGPSAGIITTLALLSKLFNRPLIDDLVVTGSIGIDLDIIPIGGERLKSLGSRDAGARTMIFPERNRSNVIQALRGMVTESVWDESGEEELEVESGHTEYTSPTLTLKKKKDGKPVFTVHLVPTFEDVLRVAFPSGS